ncbi:gamma-glutamylcyclotransferase [Defluviimonas sp. WL0002]|uniref:glutathione-specific gamma-glutamylcyclotransferase n=1 Tax=Albidovulum marisflavi TaxID=2984159 RepID=A0ABT2ZC55_9RHOB|nr:gamma-glutamylcyclotransferase [Defluviimonas sp. WL0002]MCV2868733.1 gamma-glutamylcyclotransferase [Defluviimonas sp. WL0002]
MTRHEFPYRDMALTPELVALCDRQVPPTDDDPDHVAFSDADYDRAAQELLAVLEGDPIWVFAYGSLLWNPAAEPSERRVSTARGWHRSFCIEMRNWRGTVERPGLMMALRRGGLCTGVAQRFDARDRHRLMADLLKREIGGPIGLSSLRLIPLSSDWDQIRALCFYAEPQDVAGTPERSDEEVAAILSLACGTAGSGAEYLYKTVAALLDHGIRDPHLWRLQELVAASIRARLDSSPCA